MAIPLPTCVGWIRPVFRSRQRTSESSAMRLRLLQRKRLVKGTPKFVLWIRERLATIRK